MNDQTPARPFRKVLITGLSGTLAPHFARRLGAAGAEVIGWNRDDVPPDDEARSAEFLASCRPDAILHLGFGAERWAAQLARHALERGAAFLFTSTAMVFSNDPDGPHRPDDHRSTRDDYGLYKCRCEDAIRVVNPKALILRIGWQIDPHSGGNNMISQLDRQQAETGKVAASTLWKPACSFMSETAAAGCRLLQARAEGIRHLDSNAREGLTFDRVAALLKDRLEKSRWNIVPEDTYRHDQRLIGHEDLMPTLGDSGD